MKKKEFQESGEQDTQDDGSSLPELISAIQTTVQCPVHHRLLQIQTETREIEGEERTVRFAVCNCDDPDSKHFGQRVWEQV